MDITKCFLILCILFAVTIFQSTTGLPVNSIEEIEMTGKCKMLCESCGCIGFYCGEECLCECNDQWMTEGI